MVAVILAICLISVPAYADGIKATVSANVVGVVVTVEQAQSGATAQCVTDREMMVCYAR